MRNGLQERDRNACFVHDSPILAHMKLLKLHVSFSFSWLTKKGKSVIVQHSFGWLMAHTCCTVLELCVREMKVRNKEKQNQNFHVRFS